MIATTAAHAHAKNRTPPTISSRLPTTSAAPCLSSLITLVNLLPFPLCVYVS